MAAITWTNVVDFASELATVDVDAQNDILAHVNVALKVDEFGGEPAPKLKLARIYLAAHIATLSGRAGTTFAGPVTSETAGNISRTYANLVSSNSIETSAWGLTSYGQLFAQLLRSSPARLPRAF